jgi:type 1 glutamine amidotransferase
VQGGDALDVGLPGAQRLIDVPLRGSDAAMNRSGALTRRRGLELCGAASLPLPALTSGRAAAGDTEKNRRILLFTKSSGFEHDVVKQYGQASSLAEATLADLGKEHDFDVVATKDGRIFDGSLAQYDAFFFFTTGDLTEPGTDAMPPMSRRAKQALLSAVRDGKGFIGVHSASDTFHSKGHRFETQAHPDPYIAMLGGEFFSHGDQQEARVRVLDPKFPGLVGSGEAFTIKEEWYSLKNFAPDIHVLLVLETDAMQGSEYKRPPFPLAWIRREGKGRVYYNAMGHRDDVWTSERFRKMLAGAVIWAAGETDVPLVANMSQATPRARVMPPGR